MASTWVAVGSGTPAHAASCGVAGVITGTAGNDTLIGTSGNDVICGLGGNDVLIGGDGDDTLDGGTGADVLSGGTGTDTGDYSARSVGVRVTLDGAADDGEPGEGDNAQADVENVLGGTGNDTIYGFDQANTLTGGNGNDTLTGYRANDVLLGGPGNDSLVGAAGDDTLVGADGDDILNGGVGADALQGGAGADTAHYAWRTVGVTVTLDAVANDGELGEQDNAGADVEIVLGGGGNDTITGNALRNVIYGNGGDDALTGFQGDDDLNGGGGNDTLRGALGNDMVSGGEGDDTLFPGDGQDILEGGNGTDLADYSYFDAVVVSLDDVANDGPAGKFDNVRSDVENLLGGPGNDTLTGGSQYRANTLTGGGGNDKINGGAGPDTLNGGDGNDILDSQDGVGGDVSSCGVGVDSYRFDEGDSIGPDCETRLPRDGEWACSVPPGYTYDEQRLGYLGCVAAYHLRLPVDGMIACSLPLGFTYDQQFRQTQCGSGFSIRLREPTTGLWACMAPAGFTWDQQRMELNRCLASGWASSFRLVAIP